MSEKVQITDNLFSFYKQVVRIGKLESGIIAGVPWVGSPSGAWPGYLIGGDITDTGQLTEIAAAISAGRVPSLWILESVPERNTEKLLSVHGLRMVNYWTGMYLDATDMQDRVQSARHCEIQKLSGESDIDLWVRLINRVIMTSSRLDPVLFKKLLANEKFHLYGLWKGDELLSTTLIFVQDRIAGLYFVATDEAHQGKGYGAAIADYAMNDMKAAGAQSFVLHATRPGMKLYLKKGFRAVNRYDIYWMLGKR